MLGQWEAFRRYLDDETESPVSGAVGYAAMRVILGPDAATTTGTAQGRSSHVIPPRTPFSNSTWPLRRSAFKSTTNLSNCVALAAAMPTVRSELKPVPPPASTREVERS